MSKVPEWAEGSAEDCPAEGCNGKWYRDVGGSAAKPRTIYETTCSHKVQKCIECNNVVPDSSLTNYSWPVESLTTGPGEWRTVRICDSCHDEDVVDEWIPDHVIEEWGMEGIRS